MPEAVQPEGLAAPPPVPTGPAGGPRPAPPAPERRPTALSAHGDERVDDWYWLRDADDPAVLAHLEAENAYTEASLAHLAPLRGELYTEMVARIAETDLSVPVRKGPWWYYHRTVEGLDYPIHCRRPAAPTEDPPLAPGADADEEVLLDENRLAEGLDFFEVGNFAVSPAHRWLAYATDTTGGEKFDLAFRRLGADGAGDGDGTAGAPEIVTGTYYGLAWANDERTVFYTRVDDAMRPYQLWRHGVGTDPSTDVLVLEEPDERFTLSVGRTKDDAFVGIALQSNTTSELWVVPADDPGAGPAMIERRRAGIEYTVDHHCSGWWLLLTNDGAVDFRLMAAPPDRTRWDEIVPHRPGTRLDGADVFDDWLVLSERLDGEPRVRVVPLAPGGADRSPFAGDLLDRSWLIPSDDHPSVTWEGPNPEPGTSTLRFEQTSLVAPRAVWDLDLPARRAVLRKRQAVLGDFDPRRYVTDRLWAVADDGARVPISIVHRRDRDPATPSPCLLYGYGAYEHSIDPTFSSLRLSLLDRGFVFAIAHVRGGGELGRRWYEDGKLMAKPHTFTDFITCARHLIAAGYASPERLAARGASAGGLLMGAVMNLAPELFRAVVAEVPFVDCLTTMLDDSLPLTVGEWEEWGNPVADPEAYAAMHAYSPYDNVRSLADDGTPVRYPRLLATAGLHDARVGYWEPAKWVAKLRAANPDNEAFLRTELSAGHGGPSGRYDAWKDEAFVYAFLVDSLE
jgi:oligopeptidase B